jgi:hypothetical protein
VLSSGRYVCKMGGGGETTPSVKKEKKTFWP